MKRPTMAEVIQRLRNRDMHDVADDLEALIGRLSADDPRVLDEHELAAALAEAAGKNLSMTAAYEITVALRKHLYVVRK